MREKEAAQQAALARTQRLLEADEADSESDSDSNSESDDDEENEVERSLGDDYMDTAEEGKQVRPNGRAKRKRDQNGGVDGTDWGNDDEGVARISFDIYLKGNVAKATSFFKSAEGQTQRFRMFPYVEKKRRVDEYGETVDVGMWLRKGKALEEDAESEETKEARRRKEEEEAKVCFTLLLPPRGNEVIEIVRRKHLGNRLRSLSPPMLKCSLHVDCSLWILRVSMTDVR